MWILTERNICKEPCWVFNKGFVSLFSFLSSQTEMACLVKQTFFFFLTWLCIFIFFSSLSFHYKIINEQLPYKHWGDAMMSKTKPTRARCHGDYIWKHSTNILVYTFIFIIDIIWITFPFNTASLFPEKLHIIKLKSSGVLHSLTC